MEDIGPKSGGEERQPVENRRKMVDAQESESISIRRNERAGLLIKCYQKLINETINNSLYK